MSNEQSQVIVIEGATASSVRVYHRDFPEIRSDGETPKVAATHLANELARALDSALTDWRREKINRAIAEVQAFVVQAP
jgi:hypothetical protein